MGELMKHDFIENWLPLGGELYMYLEVVSAYSRYGCWGQTEDAANLDTPRFRAIYDLVRAPKLGEGVSAFALPARPGRRDALAPRR